MNIAQSEIIERPLPWQERHQQQTASGYGMKLTTRYLAPCLGRLRRVYAICYSNVSSLYVLVKGHKVFINIDTSK
jgi:hypothetical protein